MPAQSLRPVVFTDADNTLWDTDGIFAHAQLKLLADVEALLGRKAPADRLAFVREIDQILAERHHAGLRYPPRFLVTATSRVLRGAPLDRSLTTVWNVDESPSDPDMAQVAVIEQAFLHNVRMTPTLLPGVREGLARLHAEGFRILVVSEGDRRKVVDRLEALALTNLVDRVIESSKQERLYQRVLRLVGSPSQAWMIGDQLTRDIIPAVKAGLKAVYVPSRFRPRWEIDQRLVPPPHTADSFAEAVAIILQETPRADHSVPAQC